MLREMRKLSIVSKSPANHLYSEDEPPYSPAESTASFFSSISDIAEKSASELGSLLKSAYQSLREKEKNLLLAAEVGRSLLEHNQNLKSDYDQLLETIKHCELESSRKYSIEIDEDHNMQLLSTKRTYDAMIESLERKNSEIQQCLEQTQCQSESNQLENLQKQRKLEHEVHVLRDHLEIAAQKIQELEEKTAQQTRVRQLDDRRDYEQRQTEDLVLLEELTIKMEELFAENKYLHSSKQSVEEKLLRSLHDLDVLRQDFEQFELTQQHYESLQNAFEKQKTHIKELNDSLEEHRLILSQLRDKGVWSPYRSPTPSVAGHQSSLSTCVSKQSLMGELENAWSKHCQSPASVLSKKLTDLANQANSFYNQPADYEMETILSSIGIGELHEKLLNDFDLFGPQNDSHHAEFNLYPSLMQQKKEKPKKGLFQMIQLQMRYLFRSLFKWCRFAIILSAAVLINLWKGPRLILQK